MTQTTNLGLTLVSDSAADKEMLFSDWRAYIAGTGADSNMKIIDAAIGDLRDSVDIATTSETLSYLGIT